MSRRGTSWLRRVGLLAGLASVGVALPAVAEPSSVPGSAATPTGAFLVRSSERRVRARLAQVQPAGAASLRRPRLGPPGWGELLRFEERVDVAARSREQALAAFFVGQDLLHGPTFASAPSVAESRGPAQFDPNPESPTLDLLGAGWAALQALAGRRQGSPAP